MAKGPPIKLWGIYLDNRLGGGALPPSIFGWAAAVDRTVFRAC